MPRCTRCLQTIPEAGHLDDHCEKCAGQTWVPVTQPIPDPDNPRHMKAEDFKNLKRSLKEHGLLQPIVVNTHPGRENIIIGGHQRLKAWKDIGMKTIWVQYTRLPKEQEHVLNVAFNKIMGDWDDEKLATILKEIRTAGLDVTMTGFPEPRINELLEKERDEAKDAIEDVVPTAPEKPVSKPGDLWILGDHKLLCGDSTKPEDVARLMGEDKGDAVWTDPPYGVSYTGNVRGKAYDMLVNDELRDDELHAFISAIFKNYARHLDEQPALYCCYAMMRHPTFLKAIEEAGFRVKQILIWEKGHVLTREDYHWSYEPMMYAVRKEKNSEWLGDRTHRTTIMTTPWPDLEALKKEDLVALLKTVRSESDVLEIRRDNHADPLHSTQKPVELPRRCIQNNTRPRDIILDFCAGSGSTLIACESTNRKCRAIEIDPKYADVIVKRWEAYSGKKAVLAPQEAPQ